MENITSLVQTKTFWSALLALVSIIASQFHWTVVQQWAVDPTTATNVMSGIAMVSVIATMFFRATATAKVTSVLPPSPPSASTPKSFAMLGLLLLPLLGSCAQEPASFGLNINQNKLDAIRSSYDALFLTPAAHYRQLGYCKTGSTATLAAACADRTIVARLRATDSAVRQAFNTLQADITSNNGEAASDYTILSSLVGAAEQLVLAYNLK